jgi:Cytochrome P460
VESATVQFVWSSINYMSKITLIKIAVIAFILVIGLIGISYFPKSEMQTVNSPAQIHVDGLSEIKDYKTWTKVTGKPYLVVSKLAIQCSSPTLAQEESEAKNPHNDKFINVYVNSLGKTEMMTKKRPQFPKGTVIVKEKLTTAESTSPELLTVMLKREKGFNKGNGDWEYMTVNGEATEVAAKGKLENCMACHAVEKSTDYVSRRYLSYDFMKKLK